MQKTRRLVVDAMAEVRPMLEPWIDDMFYDFSQVPVRQDTVYVIGRQHLINNIVRVRELCDSSKYTIVFDNSAEGSWTIESQLRQLKLFELVSRKKLLVISGAGITASEACLVHEHLLTTIRDYEENVTAEQETGKIFSTKQKPYKFLFLNGRARPHRKYLYERFKQLGLLNHALWTMLEATPCVWRQFQLQADGINLMATPTPVTRLPDCYELPRYRNPIFGPITDRSFLKQELFRQEWGEIYLHPPVYVDTYFSLVTETICSESDISFRTEKIAKPLVMGHPFVIAATPGYYRDLRNLGFHTFGHLIDESFDLIDNAQERIDRVIQIVRDLCEQDLDDFIAQCQETCKYNQLHHAEFTRRHRRDFPKRFFRFIQDHARS